MLAARHTLYGKEQGDQTHEFLEGLVLRLGRKIPDKEAAHAAEEGEEDVDAELQAVDHVLCREADDEVEHPVRRGHNRDAARAHAVGEDLLRQHPGDGAPGVGEVDGEEPDEGDRDPALGAVEALVQGPGVLVLAVDGRDHDVAAAHADRAHDEEGLAAKVVEEEDGGQGEDDLEYAGDARG